jgi:hypothetical protein
MQPRTLTENISWVRAVLGKSSKAQSSKSRDSVEERSRQMLL